MAFFDRFRKNKDDDFDLDDLGSPGASPQLPGMGQPMQPSIPGMDGIRETSPKTDTELLKRNLETLSYKVDTLKAGMDSINARLANIEAALRQMGGTGRY